MKTACRNLAIFALVAIAVTFVLLQHYGALLFGGVASSEEAQSVYLIFGPLFLIIAATASALSLQVV
jgi:hypothetical protein